MELIVELYVVSKSKFLDGALLTPRSWCFSSFEDAFSFMENDYHSELDNFRDDKVVVENSYISADRISAYVGINSVRWNIKKIVL